MTLFEECLEAFGEEVVILQKKEQDKISKEFQSVFPFTNWARIDWDKVTEFIDVEIEEILPRLKELYESFNNEIYIIWDEATRPII
ncbi:hypothetical protein ACFDTO_21450 [Microbacteriaceae bacterium 4G12]